MKNCSSIISLAVNKDIIAVISIITIRLTILIENIIKIIIAANIKNYKTTTVKILVQNLILTVDIKKALYNIKKKYYIYKKLNY